MSSADARCGVCLGSFFPKEQYVRRIKENQPAHAACAELACFLADWLYDDSITYAQVWRLWVELKNTTDSPHDLKKGMQLAASVEQRLSVFGESPTPTEPTCPCSAHSSMMPSDMF